MKESKEGFTELCTEMWLVSGFWDLSGFEVLIE
jgi:hypothetical protein